MTEDEKYTESIRQKLDDLRRQKTADILTIAALQTEIQSLKKRAAQAEILASERLFRIQELESLLNSKS